MSTENAHPPVPPQRLRPGQMGLVQTGHLIAGHVPVTVIDLATRGFLNIEEDAPDSPHAFRLVRRSHSKTELLAYKASLLDALFRHDGGSLVVPRVFHRA